MFYRRKILLALLESFGGSLKRTDCQKLLFLFCARRRKSYYDFFPYKYGSFSFILHQDKKRLTDLGFLTDQDIFRLNGHHSFVHDLLLEDRVALQSFVNEIGDLRGEKLIRKTYLEHPCYASRSKIASTVLEPDEYEQVSSMWNTDLTSCLFTLGYEGMSIDAFLNVLLSNNVAALVDVRKNPLSMKYGFSKQKLADYTHSNGMLYFHVPELGVPSSLRQNLSNSTAYQKLFEYYFSQILPAQGDAIAKLKALVHEEGRIALTCFEADHQFCHRHKLVEYLKTDPCFDTPVVHLKKTCIQDVPIALSAEEPFSCGLWSENTLHSSGRSGLP